MIVFFSNHLKNNNNKNKNSGLCLLTRFLRILYKTKTQTRYVQIVIYS